MKYSRTPFQQSFLIVSAFLLLGISPRGPLPLPTEIQKLVPSDGGVSVASPTGELLYELRGEKALVPASILKIATSFCALEELGSGYRFSTDLFNVGDHVLGIKGSGDPTLVSEELKRMAEKISVKMPRIDEIIIDTSFFDPTINLDGASRSLNPYDAPNGAFVGNFNTAFLTRTRSGAIVSAEPQTPLTPLSRVAGEKLKKGVTERINLGRDVKVGARYGGELLVEFLKQHKVKGSLKITLQKLPQTAKPLLTFSSQKTLAQISRDLLEYSTNFTTNQVFLILGVHKFGGR